MKKVLIFAPTAPSSGITQYILNLIEYSENVEYGVLSFNNPRLEGCAGEKGFEYYNLTLSPYKQPKEYKAFLLDVFSKYDTVYFNMSGISTLRPFKYAKKAGVKKMVMHSHAVGIELASEVRQKIFSEVHKLLRRIAYGYFEYTCACSTNAAAWMFGEKRAKDAIIIRNAVDVEKYAYNPLYRNEVRENFGLQGKKIIGHVGRFTYPKNHKFLVESFAELCKKRDDAVLLLIGEGELLTQTKDLVSELNLTDKIIFAGFTEELYKYYCAMDVFALPSLFEGFPLTLVEAQTCGLRCIVSDEITRDCDLTGRVEFLPLASGEKAWAEVFANRIDSCERTDTAGAIEEKGFSVKRAAEQIVSLL